MNSWVVFKHWMDGFKCVWWRYACLKREILTTSLLIACNTKCRLLEYHLTSWIDFTLSYTKNWTWKLNTKSNVSYSWSLRLWGAWRTCDTFTYSRRKCRWYCLNRIAIRGSKAKIRHSKEGSFLQKLGCLSCASLS